MCTGVQIQLPEAKDSQFFEAAGILEHSRWPSFQKLAPWGVKFAFKSQVTGSSPVHWVFERPGDPLSFHVLITAVPWVFDVRFWFRMAVAWVFDCCFKFFIDLSRWMFWLWWLLLVFSWGLLGAILGEKTVSNVSRDLLGFLKKCGMSQLLLEISWKRHFHVVSNSKMQAARWKADSHLSS